MLPLYNGLQPHLDQGNLGLWYTRFFGGYGRDWEVPSEGKMEWIQGAVRQARGWRLEPQLKAQQQRTHALAGGARGMTQLFETTWRFVTGLGLPHPVENGFLWHPTLGVPYLPGTSIKGLLHAWLQEWAGLEDETKADLCLRWFGNTDQAGDLVFFDALPITPPTLVPDVMTPHTGKWQEKGQEIKNPRSLADADKVPADWHSPVPVPFLVVEKATFLFAIAPRHPRVPEGEVAEAFRHLANALLILGAGAKTAVGYGRMRAVEGEGPSRPSAIPGFEPEKVEKLARPDQERTVRELAGALNAGRWSSEQEAIVALWLRGKLQEFGLWDSRKVQDALPRMAVEARLPKKGSS